MSILVALQKSRVTRVAIDMKCVLSTDDQRAGTDKRYKDVLTDVASVR